ncbi:MAG: flagellar basal body rod protein FlgC [Qipengyuania citrea]
MDPLFKAQRIAAAGMKAQGLRLRVLAENMANADTLPSAPGDQPYRRKVVTFRNVLDRQLGARTVRVDQIRSDPSAFVRRFDPQHPAADSDGYVLAPNVNPLIEMADMREALRSYEASLNVIRAAKEMLKRASDMLRN